MKFYLAAIVGAAIIIASAIMLKPARAEAPSIEKMIKAIELTCPTILKKYGYASELECQNESARGFFRFLASMGPLEGERRKRHEEVIGICSKKSTGLQMLRCYGELEDVIKNGWEGASR